MKKLSGIFFESKVRLDKITEEGQQVKFNSLFVVDACSFSECESRVIDFVSGECEILTEVHAPYGEIFFFEGEKWYRVKVDFQTVDETGKPRHFKQVFLVQADTIDGAKKNFDEAMSGAVVDYVILTISETPVEEIILRKEGENE